MKILFIQQHFSLPSEGSGGRAWEFARRLAGDGHEVTVVRGGIGETRRVVEGVTLCTVKVKYANNMSFLRRLLSFAGFVLGSLRYALLCRPDLVFASSTPLTVAIPAIVASWPRRTKFVFEVRDLWPEVPMRLALLRNPFLIQVASWLEQFTYYRADAVIALSPFMAEGVLKVRPEASVLMIPNGCDIEMFDSEADGQHGRVRASAGVREGEKMVVYAGGFGYLYDLQWCVSLAAIVKDAGIRFTFIGNGSGYSSLVEQAKKLGVYREGMFLGNIPKKEVIGFLKAADANVSVLRDEPVLEGCSLNKVFDSMAAKRPLVYNHRGWQVEEIDSAQAGWYLSRDLEHAADVLKNALSSSVELERRGNNNRILGETKYRRSDQYEALRNLFSRLALEEAG